MRTIHYLLKTTSIQLTFLTFIYLLYQTICPLFLPLIYLYTKLSLHLSVCQSFHLSIYRTICPSNFLTRYPSIYPTICQSISPTTYPSIFLCLSVRLSHLSFCISQKQLQKQQRNHTDLISKPSPELYANTEPNKKST